MKNKPIILFLSWRDIDHPQAGGAEIFTTEMLSRSQLKNNFLIVHFSTSTGTKTVSRKDNIVYIRKGNWISVIFYAMMFYFFKRERIKFVVDQCNTHRFFTPFWVAKRKQIFFIHQLTREIWKIKFPNIIGSIGEKSEDFLLRIYSKMSTMTVSPSTKKDLKEVGFSDQLIQIIPEGVSHEAISHPLPQKKDNNIFVYVGRYSEYKGLPDATKAFTKFLEKDSCAQFLIIGKKNEKYIREVLQPLAKKNNINLSNKFNPIAKRTITLLGRVSESDKLAYMKRATALIYPSKREGWGLGVTEAAILGTPSIVYNSPGLIDAVNQGAAGFLCLNSNPNDIYKHMVQLSQNPRFYSLMRERAYTYSSQFKWDNTAKVFDQFIKEKTHEAC